MAYSIGELAFPHKCSGRKFWSSAGGTASKIDAQGRQIGVNTAIAGDAQNIGFALAIDQVKPLLDQIRAGGGTQGATQPGASAGFLGVSTRSAPGVPGATVQEVVQGSAAGLEVGDVVYRGRRHSGGIFPGARRRRAPAHPGRTVSLTWSRGGERHTAKVELGSA